MTTTISKAAVIGAGSMGSGIAAHLANAGVEVVLLDVSTDQADKGVERQLKSRGFMDPIFAERITTGSIDEDTALVADAEWIVEAIFEDPQVKKETYAKLEKHRKPGSFLTSNTSTIPLATLTEGMSETQKADFAITHFFNPPRVMPLVEVVESVAMSAPRLAELREIIEHQLGKSVLVCRDTPGFIANRVGNFWMSVAAQTALDRGLEIELADAAFGKPVGVPRTGVFGLFDYIGLQIVPPIWDSFLATLDADDAFHKYDMPQQKAFQWLLDKGLTGRTGESGFYRGRGEVLDYEALEYRDRKEVTDPVAATRSIGEAIAVDSEGGRYVWDVFADTLAYCLTVADEIADTVADIDGGFTLGYSWKKGPFALADSIGIDTLLNRWRADGRPENKLLAAAERAGGFYPAADKVLATTGEVVDQPTREGVITVADLQQDATQVIANDSASVYKLADGTGLLTLATPLNTIDAGVMATIQQVADEHEALGLNSLVIASDDTRAFSAGAFLPLLAELSASGDTAALGEVIGAGNRAFRALRQSGIPVVSAVRGLALGGGAELMLTADRIVAHAETRVGFPERTVGLLPAWNGTSIALEKTVAAGVDKPHQQAFDMVMSGKPLDSAYLAQRAHLLGDEDIILMDADLVIARALDEARALAGNYTAPPVADVALYPADAPALNAAWGEDAAEADRLIGAGVAEVYSGDGTATMDELGEREVEVSVRLLQHPKNIARVEHMAKYRRPLKDS